MDPIVTRIMQKYPLEMAQQAPKDQTKGEQNVTY